jgi:tRNA (cytidine/uridine-2'-O-)-methyltransferase
VFHVILLEPEIPPNTGNIIRLCANSGATLHLIKPLGFRLDAASLRRSGLDYHDLATVHTHDSLDECRARLAGSRLVAVETGAAQSHTVPAYRSGDAFLFGPETRGLPTAVLEHIDTTDRVAIPMRPASRSLNLSNAVAVVLYEAWRQQGFAGAARTSAGCEPASAPK